MTPILQTNDLPIREIKTCTGLCGNRVMVGIGVQIMTITQNILSF